MFHSNVAFMIMLHADYYDLKALCCTAKCFQSVFINPYFWTLRFFQDTGISLSITSRQDYLKQSIKYYHYTIDSKSIHSYELAVFAARNGDERLLDYSIELIKNLLQTSIILANPNTLLLNSLLRYGKFEQALELLNLKIRTNRLELRHVFVAPNSELLRRFEPYFVPYVLEEANIAKLMKGEIMTDSDNTYKLARVQYLNTSYCDNSKDILVTISGRLLANDKASMQTLILIANKVSNRELTLTWAPFAKACNETTLNIEPLIDILFPKLFNLLEIIDLLVCIHSSRPIFRYIITKYQSIFNAHSLAAILKTTSIFDYNAIYLILGLFDREKLIMFHSFGFLELSATIKRYLDGDY